jgi:hypothetical protein
VHTRVLFTHPPSLLRTLFLSSRSARTLRPLVYLGKVVAVHGCGLRGMSPWNSAQLCNRRPFLDLLQDSLADRHPLESVNFSSHLSQQL